MLYINSLKSINCSLNNIRFGKTIQNVSVDKNILGIDYDVCVLSLYSMLLSYHKAQTFTWTGKIRPSHGLKRLNASFQANNVYKWGKMCPDFSIIVMT